MTGSYLQNKDFPAAREDCMDVGHLNRALTLEALASNRQTVQVFVCNVQSLAKKDETGGEGQPPGSILYPNVHRQTRLHH